MDINTYGLFDKIK